MRRDMENLYKNTTKLLVGVYKKVPQQKNIYAPRPFNLYLEIIHLIKHVTFVSSQIKKGRKGSLISGVS